MTDTGKGISKEHLDKIFDKFFQADMTHTGNGMGLSVVQSIARIHKGRVMVESELAVGTTFSVIFPLVQYSGLRGLNFPSKD